MALLTEDIRKKYFQELGLGNYNKTNIKNLQSKYMARKSDADGVYGHNTDNLLRHLYNCHKYLNKYNFKPEEFKCECNGRYCCGYPTYMKPAQLTNLQTIRNKYKKPMTITSGMRCKGYNSAIGGSIANSKHLIGQATDFYMQGVTDTLANRKAFIKYAVGLPNTTYIYGNGCNGYYDSGRWRYGSVSAPYMGNAIHYDTKDGNPSAKPTTNTDVKGTSKLTVDGIGGAATVRAMQKFFSTSVDGVISGQKSSLISKYCPSLKAVSYGSTGSACIKNLQRWVGVTQDGIIGQATVKAWQKKLGVTADGIFGTNSMKAWQKYLNNNDKPVYPPTPTPKKKYKVIDVSEWQGNIDFKKVKADGVVGVIIRYADGDYLDPKFNNNMKNAKANGLHIGAYIFSRAKTKAQAEKEATRLYNACKPYNCDMPLYIDLEDNSKKSYADTVAMAYLNKMKALGGKGGVYANLNWWNNYLTKTANTNPIMWVAQYYSKCEYTPASRVGMWQYSSSGSVKGISGRVDMDWCYVEYWKDAPKPTPTPTPEKQGYQGKFPDYKLVKTNAKAISDALKWAKWIADGVDFHYGYGKHSHHNGCYFCGTQYLKEGHGIKEYKTTYCCNPFVGAAWAHGGGDATAYKMCHNCDSWDFGTGKGSYHTSKLFDKVSLNSLKPGDVLCGDSHVALYYGNGKVVQAGHEDDNKIGSASWKDSISVGTWNGYKRAYRYNGKVNANRPLMNGEVSDRVADMQKFLIWYGATNISVNGIFDARTLKAVKAFQEKEMGKGQSDGIVGEKTIEAMKRIKK